MRSIFFIFLFSLVIVLAGCKEEKVPKIYLPNNAHEAYQISLGKAGLLCTALGRDWQAAANQALNNPVEIGLPFREEFIVSSRDAGSNGYRFFARRGQKIDISIDFEGVDSTLLFIDLFRETETDPSGWYTMASAGETDRKLQYEPRQEHWYILRIQPELLRGGRFVVMMVENPALRFPVFGGKKRDIGSVFNDPRDGGRRQHHGVDIFAAHHTPVIAPVQARVRSAGQSEIGGNNVWLRDSERSANLYFAHLQTIKVAENQLVNAGDTIGTVGNTGNARSTPPHLHFGIYLSGEGPVDPYLYIAEANQVPPTIQSPEIVMDEWVELQHNLKAEYYLHGLGRLDTLLAENSVVRVLGRFENQYRIELENSQIAAISPGGSLISPLSHCP